MTTREPPPEWAQPILGLIIGFMVGLALGLIVAALAWVNTR